MKIYFADNKIIIVLHSAKLIILGFTYSLVYR